MSIPEFENLKELESQFQPAWEAMFVHDPDDGRILHVNEAMLKMYGYSRQEALDINPEKISTGNAPHTVEKAYELFNKVKESGEIFFEWHDRRKNGQLFWTDNLMLLVRIAGKTNILVLSKDVSERKKKQLQLQNTVRERTQEIMELNEKLTLANEELKIINEELENYKVRLEDLVTIRTQELKRSEEKFSSVFHHSPCFVIVRSAAKGTIVEVNEAFTHKFGYSAEELTGKSLLNHDILDKEQYRKIVNLINKQGYYKNLEITLRTRSKEILFCLASGEKVMLGQHKFIIETISDITELKSIEKKLSLTEIRYSNFIEQSTEGVSYFRPTEPIDINLSPVSQARKLLNNCVLIECNDAYCKMYGFDSEIPLVNKSIIEISGDVLEDDWLKLLTEFVKSGYSLTNYQTSEITEDGMMLYFIHNLIGIVQDHKIIGVWNSRRNITELKNAEQLLRNSEKILIESERNYREIFNATKEAIFIHKARTGEVIDANQAALDLFGISHSEAIGPSFSEPGAFNPGFDQTDFQNHFSQALQKKEVVFEWMTRRKNGESFWADVSLKSSEIAGDLKVISVMRDISERKKNEEVIRQSEERFRSIIQYLTDIIIIVDVNLNIIYESPSASAVLGYPPGTLIGKSGLQLIHPDDLQQILYDIMEVFSKKNDFRPTEFRAKHEKGHWMFFEAIANNMLEHPAIHGIIITCRNISERKMVEKALKISETKFRDIFNNSSDAIIMVSHNYSILEVNDVFIKISGYTIEETRKMKVTDIITDIYLPDFVDKLFRLFQHENLPAIECEIRSKSKISTPVEINSKLIEFEGEKAMVSIIRDITERRQIENRILDTIISTEEKEREKFARNLHDELGPLLSSIKMYVNSLSSGMEKQKHDFITSQLKQILTEAIQSTKDLSNDLSPHILLNYGLLAALEWYNNQIKPYMDVHLESNLKDNRYSTSLELAIYRIIKELINNSIKHSNALSVKIKLHLILGSIRLVYSDNGAGFPNNWQDNFEFLGMGMSNIMSRCRSINALSRFYNHAPNGMSFEMEVPV